MWLELLEGRDAILFSIFSPGPCAEVGEVFYSIKEWLADKVALEWRLEGDFVYLCPGSQVLLPSQSPATWTASFLLDSSFPSDCARYSFDSLGTSKEEMREED